MKRILYIGSYDILRGGAPLRVYGLAGAKKMDYICDTIVKMGIKVDIVSPVFSNQVGFGYIPGEDSIIRDGVTLHLPPTFKAYTKIGRAIRVVMAYIWLFIYLLKEAKRNDKVLVYHTHEYVLPIVLAKKIKRFSIILQIEEKYSMIWKLPLFNRWKEDLLLKQASCDALVVSESLADILNIEKPIISYGSYQCYMGTINKIEHDNIVLVYTGLIDTDRNGGFLSMNAMAYLNDNYVLKLSGPIAEKDRSEFFKQLNSINNKLNRKAIEYLGILNDSDYESLLLSADIALNPQKEGAFGKFLFPSKILTYMSYELPVVTTAGDSIVKSEIADLLNIVDGYEPSDIAECIRKVVPSPGDKMRSRLKKLDEAFLEKFRAILTC